MHLETGERLETTYFAVVAFDYLSNPRNPIFGIRLEMSNVWILPGRYDQDAGVGTARQPGGYARAGGIHTCPR